MGVTIRAAGEGDRELIVRLLDEAFQDDPVSGWVFPGEEYRRSTHHRLMAAFTDTVLAEGRIDITEDETACALWLPMPDDDGHGAPQDGADPVGEGAESDEADEADEAARLRETVDPGNARVEQIVRLTAEIHPTGRAHAYLWMIGVVPGQQGQGLGGELIGKALDRCDRDGVPAYLEASSARSRALYERLGFEVVGEPLELPDGPTMWPMWREPNPS